MTYVRATFDVLGKMDKTLRRKLCNTCVLCIYIILIIILRVIFVFFTDKIIFFVLLRTSLHDHVHVMVVFVLLA